MPFARREPVIVAIDRKSGCGSGTVEPRIQANNDCQRAKVDLSWRVVDVGAEKRAGPRGRQLQTEVCREHRTAKEQQSLRLEPRDYMAA